MVLRTLIIMMLVVAPTSSPCKSLHAELAQHARNILRFVSLPRNNGTPVRFCIYGSSLAGRELILSEQFSRTKHKLAISEIISGEPADHCDAVYISHNIEFQPDSFAHHALTIGHGERFIDQGGIIGITMHHEKLTICINAKQAKLAGIRISSKLLEVAHRIIHP